MFESRFESNHSEEWPGFFATSESSIPSPPYTISKIASGERFKERAVLQLPGRFADDERRRPGSSGETFEYMRMLYGWTDRRVFVDSGQSAELRAIGVDLLRLDDEDLIEPPLNSLERDSIQYLVDVVPVEWPVK